MRRVEAGETFVITRNGRPIAELVPHGPPTTRRRTGREMQEDFRATLPPIDTGRWYADRARDDEFFSDTFLEY